MNTENLAVLVAAMLGSGGLGAVGVKYLGRNVDNANAEATRAEGRRADVDNLRAIIAEVRESEARKAERIDSLETRLTKLEERERHMLTRAAVHEAWDQLSFSALLTMNPQHPPPPPLALADEDHR